MHFLSIDLGQDPRQCEEAPQSKQKKSSIKQGIRTSHEKSSLDDDAADASPDLTASYSSLANNKSNFVIRRCSLKSSGARRMQFSKEWPRLPQRKQTLSVCNNFNNRLRKLSFATMDGEAGDRDLDVSQISSSTHGPPEKVSTAREGMSVLPHPGPSSGRLSARSWPPEKVSAAEAGAGVGECDLSRVSFSMLYEDVVLMLLRLLRFGNVGNVGMLGIR